MYTKTAVIVYFQLCCEPPTMIRIRAHQVQALGNSVLHEEQTRAIEYLRAVYGSQHVNCRVYEAWGGIERLLGHCNSLGFFSAQHLAILAECVFFWNWIDTSCLPACLLNEAIDPESRVSSFLASIHDLHHIADCGGET